MEAWVEMGIGGWGELKEEVRERRAEWEVWLLFRVGERWWGCCGGGWKVGVEVRERGCFWGDAELEGEIEGVELRVLRVPWPLVVVKWLTLSLIFWAGVEETVAVGLANLSLIPLRGASPPLSLRRSW